MRRCSTPASATASRAPSSPSSRAARDLPLQVAFPILIANLTGELMGGSAAPADAVKPGDPVSLPIPAGATGLRVERPDGSVVELAPGTAGRSQRDLHPDRPARRLRGNRDPPVRGGPLRPAPASPSPTPTTDRVSRTVRQPRNRRGRRRPERSDPVRGRSVRCRRVDDHARHRSRHWRSWVVRPPGRPAPRLRRTRPSSRAPPARDELWFPIVLIVLIGLCVEWALYHRDVVTRAWRAMSSRIRRPDRGSA